MTAASEKQVGTYDYVIVGAGSAGCVLANRLSADPDVRVLLLEAGGKDDYFWIKVPVGYLYTINNPRTDWCFKTEAETGLNGRALGYPRGRVLGGCSSINGMIYMRGQARDYDGWRQLGNVGWGWDDVLPYFKRHEDFAWGGDDSHGQGGEWRVEGLRLNWEILDAFREAAAEVGIPKVDDFNRGNNEGVGYFQVNQRRGRRWSTADAFLRPAMERPNLHVLTHAQAKSLIFDGKRAAGVRFWHHGEDATAAASGEVILATGSVGSPQLLQVSGVGPPDLLREHGVEVHHPLPGVGENLQDHLQIRPVYKVRNVRTLNERANSWLGKAGMGLEYFLFKRGPLTMAPSQLGCFAKSDPSRETPNLEYHVQPLSTDKLGGDLHPFPGFTPSICNLRPESRGSIHIRAADPREQPSIRPNYLSTPGDRKVAADALRLTRRIVSAKAMAKYEPEEFKPGATLVSDDDLARAAGDIGTTIFHPVGTCKMGRDDMAVVDDRLRVHGIAGLRVVDASIMPTITSGNTNSPTIMIAEKASEMIRADRKAGRVAAE
ncbi:GMC family oxidoreductase [Ferruginivarius sediminum]|uniref:Choline dehydrogenase n=1 Tax=Ferruginivarius sediminum TaxID=2661937 RepID=A0A369T5Y3_9PROT|nr:GMC family oxidoreductase N-terminal domain-containing protein [Ferruginivarius sediminum]RDD60731.1 choline dehydrogenase [Ferruginivarius sediminum]